MNTSNPVHHSFQVWRPALLAAGLAMLVGGAMHPDAATQGSVRQELADMTADKLWVPGHALLVLGTLLLVGGLWSARRRQDWPQRVDGALTVAVVALALYAVETVFHLAAVVDSDALHAGHAAPVAYTHLGLAAVLYPVSGLAVAYLAARLFTVQTGPRRAVALIGVVGGLAHTVSVPLTMLLPATDFAPVFAAAGVLLALWAVGTAGTGVAGRVSVPSREHAAVG